MTSVLRKKQELANLLLFCLDTQQGEQIAVRVGGGGKGTKTDTLSADILTTHIAERQVREWTLQDTTYCSILRFPYLFTTFNNVAALL